MAEAIASQVERAQLILDVLDHQDWTTSTELGNILGIGRQAVTPYIRALRRMGHDIESARGKGHRLGESQAVGSLLLGQDELYALFLSLSRSSTDFPQQVVKNLERRLLGLLSQRRQEQAKSLRISVDNEREFFQDFEILRVLHSCLEARAAALIRYQGLKDEQARYRKLLPVEFVPKKEWWYLVAIDLEKKAERHFRIDRILSAVRLDEEWSLPAEFERGSMHPWDFGGGSEPQEAILKLTPELARWLEEAPVHPSQRVREAGGCWEMRLMVGNKGKFVDWLMGLRGFELVGPEPLKIELKRRAQEILQTQGTFNVPWEV